MSFRNKKRMRKFFATAPALNLTPLIDTASTLLVVFMVASPIAHRAVKVELPQGVTDDVSRTAATRDLVVSCDAKCRLFIDGHPVDRATLSRAIVHEVKQSGKPVELFLAIDQAVAWRDAYALFDEVRQIKVEGLHGIAFDITRPRP